MGIELLIGAAINAGSSIAKGQAAKKSANEQASLKRAQAKELLARTELNVQETFRQGERLKGQQVTSFAGSGVDLGSSSVLAMLEDSAGQIRRDVYNMRKEANFDADQLMKGAEFDVRAGKRAATMGFIGAGTSLITGAMSASGKTDSDLPKKTDSGLPKTNAFRTSPNTSAGSGGKGGH